jgi:uncharacterized membrane protein YbhN (UPF0104 family)
MVLVTTLVVATPITRHRIVESGLHRLPLGSYLWRILDTLHGYRRSPGTLLLAVAVSLLAQLGTIAVMLILAEAIGHGGAVQQMAVLIPFGVVANSVPLTPGGLGVGEAAFGALFGIAGLQGGAAILLSWRVILLLISLVGLGIYLQGRKRFIDVSPDLQAAADRPQLGPAPARPRSQVGAQF